MWRRLYPDLDQAVLRAGVVVGGLLPLVAASAAGARLPQWIQVSVLLLALVHALRPESLAGVGVLLGAAYAWALVPDSLSPLVLLTAGGMVLAHVAAVVAAQGPARMRVDLAQARSWFLRGVGLWLAAATVWLLGMLLVDAPRGRLVYAGGLVLFTATALITTWLLGVRRDRL